MSIYRDKNNYIEIDGIDYLRADIYEEIIDDIEARVKEARDYMTKNPPRWISDAYDTIESLSGDLY